MMIELVKEVIDFYMKKLSTPELSDLKNVKEALLNEKWSYFVTIYYKWEIRWWAGNVKELKENSALELIENTVNAVSKDARFSPLTMNELPDIKIRVDKISSREVLKDKKIQSIDPTMSWVILIKKDYSKMATILPNINAKLFNWEDFIPVLSEKLKEKKINENDYIIYEIKTEVETDY